MRKLTSLNKYRSSNALHSNDHQSDENYYNVMRKSERERNKSQFFF